MNIEDGKLKGEQNYNDPLQFDQPLCDIDNEPALPNVKTDNICCYDIEGNEFQPGVLRMVFIICFILNLGNNIDHGAIPVIVPVLKDEKDMRR